MSTALTPYQNASLTERQSYAQTLAHAGDLIPRGLWAPVRKQDGSMGPPAPSPGKVLLVMETGAMLGLHPVAALQGVHVIEGKAALSPAIMTAVIRNAGHKIRVDVHGTVGGGDIRAVAKLVRSDEPDDPYIVEWTIQDAITAGLVQSYEQDKDGVWVVKARSKDGHAKPWEAYTRSMLKNRALGEVARDGAQDVLMGAAYTPEELGAIVAENGDIVDVGPEPSTDWKALLDEATTKAEVKEIAARMTEAGELTDDLRAYTLARYGTLGRESSAPSAPEPAAETPAEVPANGKLSEDEYEKQSAAEHEAYLAEQEASRG